MPPTIAVQTARSPPRRRLEHVPMGSTQRKRVAKGGRETSIDAPRRVHRAHAGQLNLPRNLAWARRQERLRPLYTMARNICGGPLHHSDPPLCGKTLLHSSGVSPGGYSSGVSPGGWRPTAAIEPVPPGATAPSGSASVVPIRSSMGACHSEQSPTVLCNIGSPGLAGADPWSTPPSA
jgi:hypothetical protein